MSFDDPYDDVQQPKRNLKLAKVITIIQFWKDNREIFPKLHDVAHKCAVHSCYIFG